MVNKEKEYGAITLDTSAFITKNKNIDFEAGLLGSMRQFNTESDSHVQFILSEIVYEEVLNHMKNKIKKAGENITNSMKFLKTNKLLDDEEINKIEILFNSFSLEENAKGVIERFVFWSGCEVIKYSDIELSDVFTKYFKCHPPFGEGKKRHEFPDAVALMSLERWAEKNGTHIIAVSEDKDWEKYARESSRIDVENNFGKALEKFQQQKEEIKKYIENIFLEIINKPSDYPVFINSLINEINDDLEGVDIDIETDLDDTNWMSENEITDIGCENIHFNLNKGFSLISVKEQEITFLLSVDIDVLATGNFAVYRRHKEDTVYLGSVGDKADTTLEAEILLTIPKYKTEEKISDSIIFTDVRIITISELCFDNVDFNLAEKFEDPTHEKY